MLIRKEVVYTRSAAAQSGVPMELEYLLSYRDGPDGLPEYGVGIRCRTPQSSEEDCVCGVTPRRERAMELLQVLAEGTVTPVSLREILQDVL